METIAELSIEKAIDPDYEEKQSLRLPKRLLARAKIQARLRGITVEEYLDELMNADADEGCPIAPSQFTPEMSKIIDEVELQWLEPTSEQMNEPAKTILHDRDTNVKEQSSHTENDKPSFWMLLLAFASRSCGCYSYSCIVCTCFFYQRLFFD